MNGRLFLSTFCFLLVVLSCSAVNGFTMTGRLQKIITTPPTRSTSLPLRTLSPTSSSTTTDHDDQSRTIRSNDEIEISRRVALVMAAAVMSAGSGGLEPALAVSLERKVMTLERQNINTVNSNGAPAKHIPQVNIDTNTNTVTVVIPHVMDIEKPHYIEYIWLQDVNNSQKVVAVQAFTATDSSPPTLLADNIKTGMTLKPYCFCNLHGLWQGNVITA